MTGAPFNSAKERGWHSFKCFEGGTFSQDCGITVNIMDNNGALGTRLDRKTGGTSLKCFTSHDV